MVQESLFLCYPESTLQWWKPGSTRVTCQLQECLPGQYAKDERVFPGFPLLSRIHASMQVLAETPSFSSEQTGSIGAPMKKKTDGARKTGAKAGAAPRDSGILVAREPVMSLWVASGGSF